MTVGIDPDLYLIPSKTKDRKTLLYVLCLFFLFLLALGHAANKPDREAVGLLLFLGFLIAALGYSFVVARPGLLLDARGLRVPKAFGEPTFISWTELASARPITRQGEEGQPINYVDLDFRDPQEFLKRLAAGPRRRRASFYFAEGTPYPISVEYFAQSGDEIAETINRYIATYGSLPP